MLSYYRASELAGALFFGRLARRTSDPTMRIFLTEHFSEEARHAWLWTDTIVKLGCVPIQILETYQSQYAIEAGLPTSMPEILVITKIFEERIYSQFTNHAKKSDAHPEVKKTIKKMLDDEDGHLTWIESQLNIYKSQGINIDELIAKYRALDQAIYDVVSRYEGKLWDFLGLK